MYILENESGRFYVGQTDDLEGRLHKHNTPSHDFPQYSHKHGPWKVIWAEEHPTRSSAIIRERQIKSMKSARWIGEQLLRRPGC